MVTSELPEARREGWKRVSLTALRRSQLSSHLVLGFLAPRTVG